MTLVNNYGKSISGYWGSPLNKWIDLNCDHKFTNINIDCFQIKLEHKIMRFIEYKHINEKLNYQQKKALVLLSESLNNTQGKDGWTYSVCIVRGDEPFGWIEVEDLTKGIRYSIAGHIKVKDWLSLNETND